MLMERIFFQKVSDAIHFDTKIFYMHSPRLTSGLRLADS